MIYFVEVIGPSHIKIGFTSKPMALRLRTLQTGNSYQLRVLGTKESGAKSEEERFRNRFRASRIRGEWYRRTPELMDLIRQETKQCAWIERMDILLGKKVTRHSLKNLESGNGLFDWTGFWEATMSRLLFNESVEEVVAKCRFKIHTDCKYLGWREAKLNRHAGRRVHFLFERDGTLLRYSRPLDPVNYRSDLRKSMTSIPRDLRDAFEWHWEQTRRRWCNADERLYL